MLDTTQTIVALSSAAGGSVRGVVRLSGPAAMAEADRLFRATDRRPLAGRPGYRRVEGRLVLGTATFPASALVFRAPKSYTGDDLVELHLPGSPPVLGKLLETLQLSGAVRAAAPGEFTARAFLNGRLDLSQAEGVLSVIRSRSEVGLRAARQLLDGAVSRISRAIRAGLIALLAELEAGIDFVEEDIRIVTGEQVQSDLAGIAAKLDDCLAHGREADVLETLPTVALVGRPNVGKSSLLNALTGRERSIVSGRAGTTRDPVTGRIEIGGRTVILVDTAGLAEVAGGDAADVLAQTATAARRQTADLTLLVFDTADGFTPADAAAAAAGDPARTMLVANKIDVHPDGGIGAAVAVSARTGAGLDRLRNLIAERLSAEPADDAAGTLGLNARHCAALSACRSAVGRAAELAAAGDSSELIALELREAAHHVGLIAGEVAADDILDRIFSQFCVGK